MRNKYLQKLAATALTTSLGLGAILAGNLDQLNYIDVSGSRVSDLRDDPNNAATFPSAPWSDGPFIELINPALTIPPPTFIQSLGEISDIGSATWVRGFIEPPQTGPYTFWVSGSDDAEFWLSSNHTEGGKTRIAFSDGNTGVGEWFRRLTQKSAVIQLEKGKQYYFELIQKSGGAAGGRGQVGWWLPDFTLERPIPIRYAQRFAFVAECVGELCDGSFVLERSVPTPIFDRNPGNNGGAANNQIFITENRPYDLSPWITSQYPVAFQWQQMVGYVPGGSQGTATDITIANGYPTDEITSGKLIANAKTAEHNQKAYRLRAQNLGTGNTSTSLVTYVTVITDTTRPTLASASAAGNTNGFNVTFSENVDPVTATTKANYVVNNGVVVDRVEMRYGETNNNTVVVYTTTAIPGNTTVTVSNVRDVAATPNTITANSVIDVLLTDGIISYFAYGAINGGSALGNTDIATLINATNRFTSLSSSAAQQAQLPFPGDPDLATTRTEIGIPLNVADNYGVLLTGFLVPPQTGSYNIVIAGDDQSIVYISPNSDPAQKVAVAVDPQWNGFRAYTTDVRRTMGNTGNSGFISSNFTGRPVANNGSTIPSNQSRHTRSGTSLVRGNKHFIEVMMKEGGGGDNVDVTWQLPGTFNPVPGSQNQNLTDGQAPIPGVYLSQAAAPGQSGPITIIEQPEDTTILENRPVTLSVVHGGSPAFSYQWYKNDVIIPDANARTYTETLPDPVSEDGAVYTVNIRNLFSQETSVEATLTVEDDLVGPGLVRAIGSPNFNSVTIWFNEIIDPATAADPGNYSIVQTGTSTELGILDSGTVTGQVSGGYTRVTFPTGPQTQGQNYTITVSGVKDIANANGGNVITAASTVSFTGWVVSKGFVLHELWFNNTQGNVAAAKTDPRYPSNPDQAFYKTLWESNTSTDIAENYLGKFSGYFFAAAGAGRYDFFIASDDNGELWLATDSNATIAQNRIAFEPAWGNRKSWTGTSDGRRAEGDNNTIGENLAVINFAANERRYMEMLFKEGGGGDYGDTTMKTPTGALPANGSDSTLRGGFIGALANPDETVFNFTTQPQSISTGEGTTAQFTVAGSGQTLQDQLNNPPSSSAVFWQWQRQAAGSTDWTDIAGANGTTYTTAALVPADNGAKIRALASIPGLTSPSAEATISTVNDVTRPTITGVSIVQLPGSPFAPQTQVRVFFSEPMLRSSIENISNYSILKGLNPVAISAAAASSDNRTVTLTVPAFASGEQAVLTATGIVDPAVAANLIDPNPTVKQFSAWTLANTIRRQLYFNIGGGDLPSLTNNAAYPNSPSVDGFVPLFEEPPAENQPLSGRPGETVLNRENFGTRITGLLVPTETANYHFAISGDDNQAFYLSTDANPANRRLVVAEPEWNGYREWTTNDRRIRGLNNPWFPAVDTLPINRTTSITSAERPDGSYPLIAGQSYYAELLAKEGGGGDSTAVTWWKVGQTIPAAGTPAIGAVNVQSLRNPDNSINIKTNPQSLNVAVGANAVFNVTAEPTAPYLGGPISYQWRRGGVNIGGATTSSYTLTGAVAGDSGATFDVVMNAPGAPTATSTAAVLTVGSGPAAPTLAITRNGNNVVVTYPTTAQAGGHALQKSTDLNTGGAGFAADATGSDVAGTFTTTVDVTAPTAEDQSYWRTRQ